MKKMNENGKPDRTAMRKMMEDTRTQVNNVLDDKQKAEFQKMQDENRKARQNQTPGNQPDKKPEVKTNDSK
jgi:hypothetical protein